MQLLLIQTIIDLRVNFDLVAPTRPSRSSDFYGSVDTSPGKSEANIFDRVNNKAIIRSLRICFPILPWFIVAVLLSHVFATKIKANEVAVPVQRSHRFLQAGQREIPIVFDVDVLVLGGTSGGVATALESQKNGAKTLLLTPYPYLGEDMTATLRLWLEPGEKLDDPLAAALFDDRKVGDFAPVNPHLFIDAPQRLMPRYKILETLDPKHLEHPTKPRLYDRNFDPARSSLQINEEATLIVEFDVPTEVGYISLLSGKSWDKKNYMVDNVSFFSSDDGKKWNVLASKVPATSSPEGSLWGNAHTFASEKPLHVKYLKLVVRKPKGAQRMLITELLLFPNKECCDTKNLPKVEMPPSLTKIPHLPVAGSLVRPLHVKKTLDEQLLKAGVPFLYSTYATSLLQDANGKTVGAIIANRAGRQAVLAKKIIFAPIDFPADAKPTGNVTLHVIGGEPVAIDPNKHDWLQSVQVAMIGQPYRGPWPNEAQTGSGIFPLLRYTFKIAPEMLVSIGKRGLLTLNRLETEIRLATFHPDIQFASDRIVIETQGASSQETVCEKRPVANIARGRLLGKTVAEKALAGPKTDSTGLSAVPLPFMPPHSSNRFADQESSPYVLKEFLTGLKEFDRPLGRISINRECFPVVGEYDVLVVGAGTSGAPAGIGAARMGAKTAVVEYLHEFGGVGTVGAISIYCYGNKVGFTQEVLDGQKSWNIQRKMQWWREELHKAGAEMFVGALACGTVVLEKPGQAGSDAFPTRSPDSVQRTVQGVLIATPDGPAVILAKNVVDATGNADVAAAAGAPTHFADTDELGIQGAGLPPINLGASYTNTDYYYIDETDMFDLAHVFVYGKQKYPEAFDISKMVDSRERRRIVGDVVLTVLDYMNQRTYPDTIMQATSNYDCHGVMISPVIFFPYPYHQAHSAYVPYRASLPRGLDGLLVAGLGTSCERDAVPLIRMQPDMQNQGYALGCAAALAARTNVSVRNIDVKRLQKHLVEKGNLPASVLAAGDNFESEKNGIPAAVASLSENYKGAPLLIQHPEESREPLRQALATAEHGKKIYYASVLAAIGDNSGASVLRAEVRRFEKWDDAPVWNKASSVHGFQVSELTRSILLLGKIKDKEAVPLIAEKFRLLMKGGGRFSSTRACIQALCRIGDAGAADVLEEYLALPNRKGNSVTVDDFYREPDPGKLIRSSNARSMAMQELMAAEALCQCGDPHGIGEEILERYSKDIRGFYSRYARGVLLRQRR